MDLKTIDVGAAANNRRGTPLRTALGWTNDNFAALKAALEDTGTALRGLTPGDIGALAASRFGPLNADVNGLLSGLSAMNVAGTSGTTLFVRPASNVADGIALRSAASAAFGTLKGFEVAASTLAILVTESLRITPTPGSNTAMGINMVGSGPAAGSTAGPFAFNKFDTTWRSTVTGDGSYGFAGSGSVYGLSVSLNVGGPNFGATSVFGFAAGVTLSQDTTSNSDLSGGQSGFRLIAKTPGVGFGFASGVTGEAGSAALALIGNEVDRNLLVGHNVRNSFGYNAANQGTSFAPDLDVAYNAECLGLPGASGGRWKKLLAFTNLGGQLPAALADDADVIFCDHAATIANFANLSTVTITGRIFNFKNLILTGDGAMTLGAGTTTAALGIGVAPSAKGRLTIAAGTANKCSLVILPGPNLDAPGIVAGGVWSNGTHLYWIDNTGTSRQLDN